MKTKALLKHLRIAPRKMRLVAELIRGKRVNEAQTILRFCQRSAAHPLQKLLQSALASAAHNTQLEESNLYIANVAVQEGSKLKRFRPRARGRAYPIEKKTSHITLVLDEIVPSTEEKRQRKEKSFQDFKRESPRAEKPKFRAAREITQTKRETGVKRFFRRKVGE